MLETKLSAWTFAGQYRQAGILIYQDDANFIKFNAISDATNTRINRMEIRSRTGGTTADGPNLDVPTGVTGDLAAADEVGHELPGRGVVQRHHLAERGRRR